MRQQEYKRKRKAGQCVLKVAIGRRLARIERLLVDAIKVVALIDRSVVSRQLLEPIEENEKGRERERERGEILIVETWDSAYLLLVVVVKVALEKSLAASTSCMNRYHEPQLASCTRASAHVRSLGTLKTMCLCLLELDDEFSFYLRRSTCTVRHGCRRHHLARKNTRRRRSSKDSLKNITWLGRMH